MRYSKQLLVIRCCLILALTLLFYGCGSVKPNTGDIVANRANAFLNAYMKGEAKTLDSYFSESVKWTITQIDPDEIKTKISYTYSIADISAEYQDYLAGLQQIKLDYPNFNMTLQFTKVIDAKNDVITVSGPVAVTITGIPGGPVTQQTTVLMKFVGSKTTWRINEIDWGELMVEEIYYQ